MPVPARAGIVPSSRWILLSHPALSFNFSNYDNSKEEIPIIRTS